MFRMNDYIDTAALAAIREELHKYSPDILERFEDLCPVEYGNDVIVIEVFYANPGFFTSSVCLKKDDPHLDFWRRWNRFRKLKAFW